MLFFLTANVSAILLLVFWNVIWKDYCIDKARFELFSLRSEIFIKAAKKEIEFNSELYEELENNINSAIRYAHKISVFEIMLGSFLFKVFGAKLEMKTFNPDKLSEAEKIVYFSYKDGIDNIIITYIINTHAFVTMALTPFVMVEVFKGMFRVRRDDRTIQSLKNNQYTKKIANDVEICAREHALA